MPPKRLTISNMPLRSGLATAGKQGTIGEDQLWRAENVIAGLDGLVFKRPGIRKWGQTIKQPRAIATGEYFHFYEPFLSASAWGITNDDASTYVYQTKQGELIVSTDGANDADLLYFGRQISGGEAEPTSNDFSLRFMVRTLNLPRGDGDTAVTTAGGTNDGGVLTIMARSLKTDGERSFRLYYDGVYCWNTGAWVRIAASDIGDGQYHVVEIRLDATATCSVYVDEVLIGTPVAATYVEAHDTMAADEHVALIWSNGVGTWTCRLADVMFKDSVTDPFAGQRIEVVTDYKTISNARRVRRYLLAATTGYVYADVGLKLAWRPIMVLTGGQPQFASYRSDLIIFDGDNSNSAKVYRWDGVEDPELLDDAPPVRFGTEHGTRLLAAGDKDHPLRVYYTASREPNTWFAPDIDPVETFDEVTEAGYIEIPGQRGDEVTGLFGDFNGFCFVTTTRGLWAISGVGPATYNRKDISLSQNGAGPMTIARIGNDLWTLGRTGVASIQTTANYGDLLASMPSAPIGNLWSTDPNVPDRIDQGQIEKSILAYNTSLGLVYLAVPVIGQSDLSAIYCSNVSTQTWYGPWVIDTTALACVEVADPVTNTMLHGSNDGRLGITDPSYKSDYGDTNYTMLLESPMLNGRSLDPGLTRLVKTWKILRLYVMPRGNWNISVTWSTDEDDEQTRVITQNMFDMPALDDTFRLDDARDGRLDTNQLIGTVDIPLDARGRYFSFIVSTDDSSDGEDFVLQGYEVDFVPNGVEQESE